MSLQWQYVDFVVRQEIRRDQGQAKNQLYIYYIIINMVQNRWRIIGYNSRRRRGAPDIFSELIVFYFILFLSDVFMVRIDVRKSTQSYYIKPYYQYHRHYISLLTDILIDLL